MIVSVENSAMGIPMLFPVTWEENIAANMQKIPLTEFFPGLLVVKLYKAYRAGLDAGRFQPWNSKMPDDYTIGYVADRTAVRADIVRDFLDAMIKTVEAGKAPLSVVTGSAQTGIIEKAGEKVSEGAEAVSKAARFPLAVVAITGVSLAVLYLAMNSKRVQSI